MQTWGTGWYLRGDIGWSSDKSARPLADPRYFSSPLPHLPAAAAFSSRDAKENSWTGGFGAGYKFNDWFRTDATVEYRKGPSVSSTTGSVICPYTATGLNSQTRTNSSGGPLALGYAYNPNDTCVGQVGIRQRQWVGLLNAYIDLGNWSGITPYVGAGAGVASMNTMGNLNYYTTATGASYGADLTAGGGFPLLWINPANGAAVSPQPNIAFARQNWDRTIKSHTYRFAWALMGGVAIDVSQNAKIDVGYRYLNMGAYKVYDGTTGQEAEHKATAHEVRVGFRYMID
jgi:opacity protein-like surface antigen